MASNILNIGKSALSAAQVGLSTTGHNIANASTPGFSRQVVVQSAAEAQNFGFGYIGQGTQVASITRVYSELLARQAINSQAVSASVDIYSSNLSQVENLIADSAAGLNPALNDFFTSIQNLATNPSDTSTRQTALSYAQSMVNRFQSTNDSLNSVRNDVNTQLTSSASLINSYATQIARLNDVIEKAINAVGSQPNDLLDQRDQLVMELSKQIKTTVVPQNQGSYNIFIGNGLPLVVGTETNSFVATTSPTDASRLELAYVNKGKTTVLGIDSLPGGAIGGLLQFRSESLDTIQNKLGQIAVTLAETFNAQHAQGLDKNGLAGGDLFNIPNPTVTTSSYNTGNGVIGSQIVDGRAVTSSDYRLQYDGSNYIITRLSDKTVQNFASLPQTVDGISFNLTSGSVLAGDDFVVRPTQNAASGLSLAITDPDKLALAGSLNATAATTNTGTGKISAPAASSNYASSPLVGNLTLSFASGLPSTLTLAPSAQPVTVTSNGVSTVFAAGTPVTYSSGATISVGGFSFAISGNPANGDQFTISPSNSAGPADNRNGILLSALHSQGTLNNSKTSYTDAFSQVINTVGNKSRELKVISASEAQVLAQATAAIQSESGVNLDEEATNLIRYQQAYQAAGKMMQIASQLFDVLLQLGQ